MTAEPLWIFGYGSLIWDGWEEQRRCLERTLATLSGYERTFNKASVVNWGTKAQPCPTLNLRAEPLATCRGIAFCFAADDRNQVLDYLQKREGANFVLTAVPVRLDDGRNVEALVPLYTGKNLLGQLPLPAQLEMIRLAVGRDGTGYQYVKGVAEKLASLNVHDPVVVELWAALQ